MPTLKGHLTEGKPLIEVALIPVLPPVYGVVPQFTPPSVNVVHYRALLDTGADVTSICSHVINTNSLRPVGLHGVTTVKGTNNHRTYLVNIGLLSERDADFEGDNHKVKEIFLLPRPLLAIGITDVAWFDIIIGMDIISQGELKFFRGGSFEFKID